MTTPSIRLRPGTGVDEAIQILRTLEANSRNDALPVGMQHPSDQRDAYVRWATSAEKRLRSVFPWAEIAALLGGPRHRDICSMTPGSQLIPMMNAELDAQSDHFGHLAGELEQARDLFRDAGRCIIPDTSFYIEHPEKLEEVDFHALTQDPGPVRVVVPIIVVDELDGLKKGPQKSRWRAGYTVAVIDRVILDPPQPAMLRPKITIPPRGEVTLQILFDPPSHRRMPINDDEIVDRSLACQPFAKDVTIVTYDTGQSTRARTAGLKVTKLRHEPGPEPTTNGPPVT